MLIGVVFGIVAMVWPDKTVVVLVVLWGCWALVDGIMAIGAAGFVQGTGSKVVMILLGVVSLGVAFFALVRPELAAATLTWFLGIWLVVRGVSEIIGAFRASGSGRWVLALGGVVDGAIGVLFIANPGTAALSIAWLLGLLAFVWGLAFVAIALGVRHAAADLPGSSPPKRRSDDRPTEQASHVSTLQTILTSGALLVVIDLAIRLVALIVIPRDRLPTAAMAWLLAVFFIPVIGVGLFLLIGNPKLPEKRRLKQVEMDHVIADESKQLAGPSAKEDWPVWLDSIVTLTQNLTAMPIVGGNSAHLLADYEGSLAAMAEDIDAATSYVHVEFYILSLDQTTAPFFDSLEKAAARGVTVRVLLDHWASSHCRDYKATIERLDRDGGGLAADAAGAAAEGEVPAARPAQPPQAAGRRRDRRRSSVRRT